jgi:endonuclease YncB( thermonuclease family)
LYGPPEVGHNAAVVVRRAFLLGALAVLTLAVAAPALGARRKAEAYRITGTVVRAIDGATLELKIAGGRVQRVALAGVAAPKAARGECFAAQATDRLASLASGRRATVRGEGARSTAGQARAIVAYVDYAGGDLGQKLIAGGFARVDVAARPFARLKTYQAAEAAAQAAGLGLWAACAAAAPTPPPVAPASPPAAPPAAPDASPPPPPAAPPPAPDATPPPPPAPPPPAAPPEPECHPSYPSLCVSAPPPKLSCGDLGVKDFPVRWDVPNPDPQGFDGDGNGIGCQSPCPKMFFTAPLGSAALQAYRERPGRRRRRRR